MLDLNKIFKKLSFGFSNFRHLFDEISNFKFHAWCGNKHVFLVTIEFWRSCYNNFTYEQNFIHSGRDFLLLRFFFNIKLFKRSIYKYSVSVIVKLFQWLLLKSTYGSNGAHLKSNFKHFKILKCVSLSSNINTLSDIKVFYATINPLIFYC